MSSLQSTSGEIVRVGIIGCGGIGSIRAAALKHLSSYRLQAVSDVDVDRAQAFADRYGGTVAQDWRAMVHAENVDAVIVCTPPHLHAEMCIEALKAGKHVLCEKPLARTPDECRCIVEAAGQGDTGTRRHGDTEQGGSGASRAHLGGVGERSLASSLRERRSDKGDDSVSSNLQSSIFNRQSKALQSPTHPYLATGFNYRFYPSVRKAKELLDAGVIGELDHVRSYAGYSAAEHGHPWLSDVEIMGGGALRDNGIHLIDLTCYFLGEVADVKGFASNSVWQFKGCEDNGFALLRSTEGKIASLHASWTEWKGYELRVELYGTHGCIRIWCFPMLTQVVWAKARGEKTRKRLHFFPMTHLQERLRSYRWVVLQSFILELQAFWQAIHGSATIVADGHDGLRSVEIAHAVAHTSD